MKRSYVFPLSSRGWENEHLNDVLSRRSNNVQRKRLWKWLCCPFVNGSSRRSSQVIKSLSVNSGFPSLMYHGLILKQAPALKAGLHKAFCSSIRFRFVLFYSIDHVPQCSECWSLSASGISNVIGSPVDPLLHDTQTLLIASRTLKSARRWATQHPHGTCLAWWWSKEKGRSLRIARDDFTDAWVYTTY